MSTISASSHIIWNFISTHFCKLSLHILHLSLNTKIRHGCLIALHVLILRSIFQRVLNVRCVQLVIIVRVELLNPKLVLLERLITCLDSQI